jgi:hypothetical protein
VTCNCKKEGSISDCRDEVIAIFFLEEIASEE